MNGEPAHPNARLFCLTFAGLMAMFIVSAAISGWIFGHTFASEMVRVGLFGIPMALITTTVMVVGRRRKA